MTTRHDVENNSHFQESKLIPRSAATGNSDARLLLTPNADAQFKVVCKGKVKKRKNFQIGEAGGEGQGDWKSKALIYSKKYKS
jgi:hypothetical protein